MNKPNLKIGVLDDTFPSLNTGFRIEEFNWLIEHLNAHIFSNEKSTNSLGNSPYATLFPQNVPYIHPIDNVLQDAYQDLDLLYIVFTWNAKVFLPYVKKLNKPFIFSAYNSSLININSPATDQKFSLILNDPLCKGVIVAQKMWYDYLIKKNFCPPDKIKFIYGGLSSVSRPTRPKQKYKVNKKTFDICFTAYIYLPSFIHSKGYDFFIEVARKLIKKDPDFRFHIMGSAVADTLDVSDIKDFITFHGVFNMKQFADIYPSMDIMLSPTRPTHTIVKGITQTTADGFPTISSVDAAKCGVFLMVTDLMNNNIFFKNNENICIIPDNIDIAVQKILFYKNNLDLFYKQSLACQNIFQKIFNTDYQMQQRVDFFTERLTH